MEFISAAHGPVDIVVVKGKLDYAASTEFDSRLRGLMDQADRRFILMDFSEVTVLSSPSLRAILTMAKRLRRVSGHFAVVNPSEIAVECFKISGFLKLQLFDIETDPQAALQRMLEAAKPAGQSLEVAPPAPAVPPKEPVEKAAANLAPLEAALRTAQATPGNDPVRPPNPMLVGKSAPPPVPSPEPPVCEAGTPTPEPEPGPGKPPVVFTWLRYTLDEVRAAWAYWFIRRR